MRQTSTSPVSRRDFVKSTAAAATIGCLGAWPRGACRRHRRDQARARSAAAGAERAPRSMRWGTARTATSSSIAMADAFAEPLERALPGFAEPVQRTGSMCPPDRRFVGLDAYEKAIAAGADIVMLCTPPGFRPIHFAAAVKAGKHVFLEKPVAVDAPGYRAIKSANAEAKKKGLYVAVGHHLRHAQEPHGGRPPDPRRPDRRPALHPRLLQHARDLEPSRARPGMTEMQYQVNNWYHFVWLSGDHNVEQHVHGIDACNWIAQAAAGAGHGHGRPAGPRRAGHRRDLRPPLRSVHLRRRLVQLQRVPPAAGNLVQLQPSCRTGRRDSSASTATTRW